jgi:hypothetical protein
MSSPLLPHPMVQSITLRKKAAQWIRNELDMYRRWATASPSESTRVCLLRSHNALVNLAFAEGMLTAADARIVQDVFSDAVRRRNEAYRRELVQVQL